MTLGTRLAHGAALMVALRWASRGLGLVSAMVLARLLSPTDFGLVAVALAVATLLEMIFDASAETSIISRGSRDRDDWNTAWSIRIIAGMLIALCLCFGSILAAYIYDDQRYYQIFILLGLAAALSGFENIGIIGFRLDFKFDRDASYLLICRIATVGITVSCAYVFQDYMAILVAGILGKLFQILWSYHAHSFRPKWSLVRWRVFLSFSFWMLVMNIGRYLLLAFDRLLLAGFVSPRTLGHYKVAADVAELPVSEVVLPIARTLGVGFASVRSDPTELRSLLRIVIGLVALLIFPVSIGMILVAETFVSVLLGAQWSASVPYVKIFAFFFMVQSLVHYCGTALIALEAVRPIALVTLISGAVFLLLSFLLARYVEILWAFSLGRAVMVGAFSIGVLLIVRQRGVLSFRDFLGAIWRPCIASLVMAFVMAEVSINFGNDVPDLLARVALGAATYIPTLLGLWVLSGRPESAEATLLTRASPKLAQLLGTPGSA